MKRFLLGVLSAFAVVLASPAVHAQEVYGTVGTEGLGLGLGYSFTSNSNVRAEFDGFSLSHNFTAGDLQYQAKLNLAHGGLYGDFFPFPQTFAIRLTAGLLIGDDNLNATATAPSGTYTFNGVTVSSTGESVTAKAKLPTVRPYVGLGFGHNPSTKGLSVSFDAGAAFGKPTINFNVPANIVAEAGQANVNAEEQNLQNKANDLKVYPIIKIGLTYRF